MYLSIRLRIISLSKYYLSIQEPKNNLFHAAYKAMAYNKIKIQKTPQRT